MISVGSVSLHYIFCLLALQKFTYYGHVRIWYT